MKCPVCGVEDGPCAVQNGESMYHTERIRAANPTRYEHPECGECRKLKDAMVAASDSVREFQTMTRSMVPRRPRSRWPKDHRQEMTHLEYASNEARAEYELHLFTAHQDRAYESNAVRNLEILLREGRLRP